MFERSIDGEMFACMGVSTVGVGSQIFIDGKTWPSLFSMVFTHQLELYIGTDKPPPEGSRLIIYFSNCTLASHHITSSEEYTKRIWL